VGAEDEDEVLIEMMRTSDQKISESTPRTLAGVTAMA
jgi:hypothetical protein